MAFIRTSDRVIGFGYQNFQFGLSERLGIAFSIVRFAFFYVLFFFSSDRVEFIGVVFCG